MRCSVGLRGNLYSETWITRTAGDRQKCLNYERQSVFSILVQFAPSVFSSTHSRGQKTSTRMLDRAHSKIIHLSEDVNNHSHITLFRAD